MMPLLISRCWNILVVFFEFSFCIIAILCMMLIGRNFINYLGTSVVSSPDGQYCVVEYDRTNAAGIFSEDTSNISLFRCSDFPIQVRGAGNLFACGSASPLWMKWKDNRTLEIAVSGDVHKYNNCSQVDYIKKSGIRLLYRQSEPAKADYESGSPTLFASEDWVWRWEDIYTVKQKLPED